MRRSLGSAVSLLYKTHKIKELYFRAFPIFVRLLIEFSTECQLTKTDTVLFPTFGVISAQIGQAHKNLEGHIPKMKSGM